MVDVDDDDEDDEWEEHDGGGERLLLGMRIDGLSRLAVETDEHDDSEAVSLDFLTIRPVASVACLLASEWRVYLRLALTINNSPAGATPVAVLAPFSFIIIKYICNYTNTQIYNYLNKLTILKINRLTDKARDYINNNKPHKHNTILYLFLYILIKWLIIYIHIVSVALLIWLISDRERKILIGSTTLNQSENVNLTGGGVAT